MPVLYSRGIKRKIVTKISCVEIMESVRFFKSKIFNYVPFLHDSYFANRKISVLIVMERSSTFVLTFGNRK